MACCSGSDAGIEIWPRILFDVMKDSGVKIAEETLVVVKYEDK